MPFNMLFRKRRRRRCRRRGTSALEFAIIMPLLITIVLGCIDFGRFAYTYIAVTNAARTGAGFGSAHPYTTTTQTNWAAKIRQAAVNELCESSDGQPTAFQAAKITTSTPIVTTETSGQRRLRLTVSYPFEMLFKPPFLPNAMKSMVIQQTVEMRMV